MDTIKFIILESYRREYVLRALNTYRASQLKFIDWHKRLGSQMSTPYVQKRVKEAIYVTRLIAQVHDLSYEGFCLVMLNYYTAQARKRFTIAGHAWYVGYDLQPRYKEALQRGEH